LNCVTAGPLLEDADSSAVMFSMHLSRMPAENGLRRLFGVVPIALSPYVSHAEHETNECSSSRVIIEPVSPWQHLAEGVVCGLAGPLLKSRRAAVRSSFICS
jgi:hypothetical protein